MIFFPNLALPVLADSVGRSKDGFINRGKPVPLGFSRVVVCFCLLSALVPRHRLVLLVGRLVIFIRHANVIGFLTLSALVSTARRSPTGFFPKSRTDHLMRTVVQATMLIFSALAGAARFVGGVVAAQLRSPLVISCLCFFFALAGIARFVGIRLLARGRLPLVLGLFVTFFALVPRHRLVFLVGRLAIFIRHARVIGFLTLSALVPINSRAQLLVEAPVLETIASNQTGIMATMNLTLNAIEQAERKVETIKQVAGWIDRLQSMQEFIRLLETTACLAKDLDINLRIALDLLGPGAYCLSDFEYRLNINRLRYVVDVINLVLTDGFSMSRSGRMEAYHDALSTFQKAQMGLGELALFLKRIIRRYERAQAYRESLLRLNDTSPYKTHTRANRF